MPNDPERQVVRTARGCGCLRGWIVVFVAIAAAVVAVSFLISGQPPDVCGFAPWPPQPPQPLPFWSLSLAGTAGATLLVGVWWALGADTVRTRIWRLMFPVPLAVLVAGFVGLLPGELILCT